ncbi:MAG: hypothetical protein QOF48_3498 [Verrucomicrobiota bacterium]|jgi:N-acyl-D-amino-acid deacylase
MISPRTAPPRLPVSRRRFLKRTLAAAAVLSGASGLRAAEQKPVTVAEAFDPVVLNFMSERDIPGAALAVAKDRRLVYAQGYGWADRALKIRATPDSLFRIASISKPFTAVAVLQLVEQNKLSLDAPVYEFLELAAQQPKALSLDERWKRITLRHLLHHTAGWDRDASGDPMFKSREIASAFSLPPPAGPAAIIRWMLGKPLDFDPGSRYAYSNFGYCLLGRVIEKATGQPYEKWMRKKILRPAGIHRMRIGASRERGRAPGEVCYYTTDHSTARSVFGEPRASVPSPYGGFCLEAMDSHGGWIASAVDLVRFATALNDPARSPLLKSETFAQLSEPPSPPVSRDAAGRLKEYYYGCGWQVRPVGSDGKANYWHNGSLPGTSTYLFRLWNGISYAILFNQRSEGKKDDSLIDPALGRAAAAVTKWPDKDSFESWK